VSTSPIVEVLASQLDKDDSSDGVHLDPPGSHRFVQPFQPQFVDGQFKLLKKEKKEKS